MWLLPSSVIDWLIPAGLLPKCSCQRAWPSTATGAIFVSGEGAAQTRLHAEQREERVRDLAAHQSLGLGYSAEVHRAARERRKLRKRPAPLFPGEELAVAGHVAGANHRSATGRHLFLDLNQLTGITVGQGTPQDGVSDCEHRGVHANAQGQHQHHHDGEARMLEQHPQPVTEILAEAVPDLTCNLSRRSASFEFDRESGVLLC